MNVFSGYAYIPQFPVLQAWAPVQPALLPHLQVVPTQKFPFVQAEGHVGDAEIIGSSDLHNIDF